MELKIFTVPKNLRHTIYSEACGEVEVLQDLGTGTYGALTTVIKWVPHTMYLFSWPKLR